MKAHSSSQSPAMNIDRSAVSIRLYMEKFPLIILTKLTGFFYISLCKTCDLRGEDIFGPQGHDLQKNLVAVH